MQLSDYTIHGQGNTKLILFNDLSLNNLEDLLNSYLSLIININNYLDQLYEIRDNWSDLDEIVENKYNGYWDWEILQEMNEEGTWFTFAGYEDFSVDICVDNQQVYIENDMFPEYPRVIISLNDFIDVLEQWKIL